MDKKQFTKRQISDGFKQLEGRITQISIITEIISPFYTSTVIYSHPLHWIINQLALHVVGQVTRTCFDEHRSPKYKTLSICEIYNQIISSRRYQNFSIEEKRKMSNVKRTINSKKRKYEKRLKKFTDKYYAHLEHRKQKQITREYEKLEFGINDLKKVTQWARKSLNIMRMCWENQSANFAEGQYTYFSEGFRSAIQDEILEPISHLRKI